MAGVSGKKNSTSVGLTGHIWGVEGPQSSENDVFAVFCPLQFLSCREGAREESDSHTSLTPALHSSLHVPCLGRLPAIQQDEGHDYAHFPVEDIDSHSGDDPHGRSVGGCRARALMQHWLLPRPMSYPRTARCIPVLLPALSPHNQGKPLSRFPSRDESCLYLCCVRMASHSMCFGRLAFSPQRDVCEISPVLLVGLLDGSLCSSLGRIPQCDRASIYLSILPLTDVQLFLVLGSCKKEKKKTEKHYYKYVRFYGCR